MRQAHNYSNLPSKTLFYFYISLPIPICRHWTSLGNTVFMQIVSSYNYERLIRSISTPNKYALFLLIFLLLFLRPSFFTPLYFSPLFFPSISALSTYTLYSYLYSYSFILTPSLPTPYYSPSLYVHIIYTLFSQKIFPKKISTPKAYPKIFPKFLLIIITPPLYSSIGK